MLYSIKKECNDIKTCIADLKKMIKEKIDEEKKKPLAKVNNLDRKRA